MGLGRVQRGPPALTPCGQGDQGQGSAAGQTESRAGAESAPRASRGEMVGLNFEVWAGSGSIRVSRWEAEGVYVALICSELFPALPLLAPPAGGWRAGGRERRGHSFPSLSRSTRLPQGSSSHSLACLPMVLAPSTGEGPYVNVASTGWPGFWALEAPPLAFPPVLGWILPSSC